MELNAAFAAPPTITETANQSLPRSTSPHWPQEKAQRSASHKRSRSKRGSARSLLVESNVQVLQGSDTGDPSGKAWAECGQVDHRGHDLGTLFPAEVEKESLRSVTESEVFQAGWSTVHIVTDHGWLLLPNGLEKVESLPSSRTALVKADALASKRAPTPTSPRSLGTGTKVKIASPGIACFTANQVYEHGGVSPQECSSPADDPTRIGLSRRHIRCGSRDQVDHLERTPMPNRTPQRTLKRRCRHSHRCRRLIDLSCHGHKKHRHDRHGEPAR